MVGPDVVADMVHHDMTRDAVTRDAVTRDKVLGQAGVRRTGDSWKRLRSRMMIKHTWQIKSPQISAGNRCEYCDESPAFC